MCVYVDERYIYSKARPALRKDVQEKNVWVRRTAEKIVEDKVPKSDAIQKKTLRQTRVIYT